MKNLLKNDNLNFTLYLTISSIFFNFIFLNNISITYFKNIAFLIPLVLGAISILFIIILPKQPINNKYLSKFIKLTVSLYYIVFNAIIILTCVYILTYYFYQKTSFLLMSLLISLVIILLTEFSSKHLYDISLTLYLFIIIFNGILIFNTSFFNIDLIHNINFTHFFNNDLLILLSMLFILFDPITHYISNIPNENINLKSNIIISIAISTLISSLTIFINYLYYSSSYLSQSLFPALSFISSLFGPEFLDYFTILILINTLVFTLLKASINITTIKEYFKKVPFLNIILTIFIFIMSNLIFKYKEQTIFKDFYIGFILTFFIFIIYFWLIKNKEVNLDATTNIKK